MCFTFGRLTFRAARKRRTGSLQSCKGCRALRSTWTTWRGRTGSCARGCRSRRHCRTVQMTIWGWEQIFKIDAEILLITNSDMTFLYVIHQHSLTLCPPPQVRCQTLTCKLQDVQDKLAAEKEETKNTKRRAEYLDGELQQVRGQLDKVIMRCDQEQLKSSKLEVKLKHLTKPRYTMWPKVCGQVVYFRPGAVFAIFELRTLVQMKENLNATAVKLYFRQ